MRENFIPYEQALELKELGFDEPCMAFYTNLNSFQLFFANEKDYMSQTRKDEWMPFHAPLYQQAFRWFREKYDLKRYGTFPHHTIMFNYLSEGGKKEEAELVCLIKLIEIAKNK